jgi:4-hydroxy-tetrahydrodipicolinate reductase
VFNLKEKIKVVHYGIGPIGLSIAELVSKKKGIESVGAIDLDPQKVGKDLGEIIKLKQNTGIIVSDNSELKLKETKPDIVIHTTSSSLIKVLPQLEEIAKSGANIISTCEELSFPWRKNKEAATKIDRIAKDNNITILGTGVNPGFVLDSLVLALSGACQEIESIKGIRVVDASTRRLPLQKKIGAGMDVKEFEELMKKEDIGHVGLTESVEIIAYGLGIELEEVKQQIKPKIAESELETKYFKIQAGKVCGIEQEAIGTMNGKRFIELKLEMFIGATNPSDKIIIEGNPKLETVINNGTAGDIATAAIIVNSISNVIKARPGVTIVNEIPMPSAIIE